jgi:cytochrome c oxidase cbb3-type subunit 4
MDTDQILVWLRSLWLVWLVLLFLGIVAYVFWPKRKKRLEAMGRIPMDDDKPKRRGDGEES